MNTAEFLQISAMVVPDRTALVCGDQRVTFAEMADRVNRLANWLQSTGAGPDRPVGAMSVNGIEYVEAYYAAAKIGATFVPLNYRAKHDELTYMINSSEIHVLFAGERYLDLVGDATADTGSPGPSRLLRCSRRRACRTFRTSSPTPAPTSPSWRSTRAGRPCSSTPPARRRSRRAWR